MVYRSIDENSSSINAFMLMLMHLFLCYCIYSYVGTFIVMLITIVSTLAGSFVVFERHY